MSKTPETLTFQVADIKFAKDGFHIVRTTKGDSVAGKFAARVGHCYKSVGNWDCDSDKARLYGPTFKLESAVSVRMTSPEALGRFLTLQLRNKGVGEAVIGSLVDACKTDNLDMEDLLDKSQRDVLIECVGKRNAKKVDILLDIWPKIKPAADLVSPLLGYGLTEAQAEAALALWGKSAVERVEDEPYDLILRIDGISFLSADRIAMKVGRITKTDPIRLRAAFSTGMRDATANGDIGVRRKRLIEKTMPLVNESILDNGRRKLAPGVPPVVSPELLAQVLDNMIRGEYLGEDGEQCGFASNLIEFPDEGGEVVVWYKPLVMAEQAIATRLPRFCAAPRLDLVARVDEFSKKLGATLAPEQHAAVEMILKNPVSIVTGGPGCGKSFMLKVVLAAFDAAGLKGALTAPTGKAAKRITESTGRHAQTQHSLLGYSVGGKCAFDETCPLPIQYLCIDESSMDDTELMAATLRAAPDNCRIIIVGDVDQLASVGPGQVLRDLIRSGCLPVTRLTKGFRFSGGIAAAARAVNAGQVPESSDDGQYVYVDTEEPLRALMETAKKFLEEGVNADDVQALSPTHRGDAGCTALNKALQDLINPMPAGGTNQRLKRDGGDIWVNDRVLQTKNDRELGIVNGDVGWLVSFDTDKSIIGMLLPDKDKPVMMQTAQATNLKLAYAITVHKSQGAEAPYIFIALDRSATFMLRRNLVYTAISRGIKKVVVFSPRSTLTAAVRRGEPPEGSRRTSLVPKLLEAFTLAGRKPAPALSLDPLAAAMRVTEEFDDVPL